MTPLPLQRQKGAVLLTVMVVMMLCMGIASILVERYVVFEATDIEQELADIRTYWAMIGHVNYARSRAEFMGTKTSFNAENGTTDDADADANDGELCIHANNLTGGLADMTVSGGIDENTDSQACTNDANRVTAFDQYMQEFRTGTEADNGRKWAYANDYYLWVAPTVADTDFDGDGNGNDNKDHWFSMVMSVTTDARTGDAANRDVLSVIPGLPLFVGLCIQNSGNSCPAIESDHTDTEYGRTLIACQYRGVGVGGRPTQC